MSKIVLVYQTEVHFDNNTPFDTDSLNRIKNVLDRQIDAHIDHVSVFGNVNIERMNSSIHEKED